ncbi:MAG: class I SAM-dependent methyltransferase [Gammaproteobacteria bacterium]|jgi:SAM-dependent methyltransferase|nr:class I SAM-dependent methyltransferase [Gammaproteobacteria bacterium]MBT4493338.1 class I SAM-dependent methyltransferase [Gammaproteobacteria bacterium]MBT7370451.1 class I SAM-dependent methyltransferase [Gammaproteobacteria bacterium]
MILKSAYFYTERQITASELSVKAPINNANFGNTAEDYLTHRAGFPASLFKRLIARGIGSGGQQMVDLGTGTGTLARRFTQHGNHVIGLDPAAPMLEAAAKLDKKAAVSVEYRVGTAENTQLPDAFADVVLAGQCWHWFDADRACMEIARILKTDGTLVVAYYDWLPLPGNLVRKTESLIEQYNPAWRGGNGSGIHPGVFKDLGAADFQDIQSFTYDEAADYTHEGWRGRIRASAGCSATLPADQVSEFDDDLDRMLKKDHPDEPLSIPHRVFAAWAKHPASD